MSDTVRPAPQPEEFPAAQEFRILLDESAALAATGEVSLFELDELDAINKMRVLAEELSSESYVFHSGTL